MNLTHRGLDMKICKNCNIEFKENKSNEKYCSHKCCSIFHSKKRQINYKDNPELRKKRNEYEKERNKKVPRRRDRLKHNAAEKERYRKKHGINSDDDLRCAPRGSGTLTKYGYRQIIKHGHPNSQRRGAMFEHVFIMAEYLKRPLFKGETVHHKNGIRHDNRIENLELWTKAHPYGQRVEDKIDWCKEFLNSYGFNVIKIN